MGKAPCVGVSRPDTQDRQLQFASYFGDLGNRKKAPEPLRSRAEGILQDNDKVLLVSNIRVDGQPIGAFGEGEFWFHIDSGYTLQVHFSLRPRAAVDRRQHEILEYVQSV